jgi:hypothetical protein
MADCIGRVIEKLDRSLASLQDAVLCGCIPVVSLPLNHRR